MKRIALAATALSLIAAPAFAGDVTVNASVTAVCSVANPSQTLDIGEIAVDANGDVASQSSTHHFGNIWCNGSSNTITVSVEPLENAQAVVDTYSFTNQVEFQLTTSNPGLPMTWHTVSNPTVTVTDIPAFETGTGAYDQFTITTVAGSKRPIAGDYSGAIRLTITPGI
ncbi:hypothetical protein [Brevundimonas lenta]|uniref:Spore coat protein U domain-containing protein n=1 Tax=Brevundimonas lenta TaxID=424796 RepID=A0A7W6JDT1_9CAUL|nr:hypothetical protein [Brevundimonas lenta]MBB4082321.1 hypothetical protein [Brevundimonas lenta]